METKHLYKSNDDKAIFGVCGGVAEYFGIDSLIVRLLFVLFTLVYGSGILIYIIAALVIPKKPERLYEQDPYSAAAAFGRDNSYVKADFAGGSPYGSQNYQARPASAETIYRTSSTQAHYGAGAAPAEAPVRQASYQPQPAQPAPAQPASGAAQEVRDAVSASMAAMEQLSEQLKAQEAAAGSAVTPEDPVKAAVQAAAEQVFDAPDAEYDDVDASTAEGDEALNSGEAAAAGAQASGEAPAPEAQPAPGPAAYEAPKAEAPKYEAPKAEAPKYEAPKNDRYDQFQAFQNSYTRPEKNSAQSAGGCGSYQTQAPKQGQPGQSGKTVNTRGRKSIGMILILVGALLVLRVLIPHIDFRLVWGAAAIIAGAYLFMVKN